MPPIGILIVGVMLGLALTYDGAKQKDNWSKGIGLAVGLLSLICLLIAAMD